VIGFRSVQDYEPYRIRESSNAYYVGSESRDYIVMAGLGPSELGVAAHEFAHVVLRATSANLPLWLREGLADALSTVRISARGATIGGDLPGRMATLRHDRWIPLPALLTCENADALGGQFSIFYAESWALADLVLLAPAYAPRFPQFVAALATGAGSRQAFAAVYGKSLEAVETDLQRRNLPRARTPEPLPAPAAAAEIASSPVPAFRARLIAAEVAMLTSAPERAGTLYRELERQAPADPDVSLGLGFLALRQGHPDEARRYWKRAVENGASDPALCFRYASLAGMAGVPPEEIRPALERAVQSQPDFDDARYSLALLEANTGHPEAAIANLRAMRAVAPGRAYNYWTALADAFIQTGDRNEAKSAALKAAGFAATPDERRHALELAHVAETDLAVRMARDAQGRPHMVTTRIRHGDTDFNPFIEPGDAIVRLQGVLRQVECSGAALRLVVETADGAATLAIRALDRIQIRNGAGEFTCGPQPATRIKVEFARFPAPRDGVAGEIRGLEFLSGLPLPPNEFHR
ncbi:MAG TPA: hypothetical protein VGS58_15385, partial [Candidatus Sulfopaludibacter sp.]|nr:hypothetical protein [Candidatus Sulfopaludibacter sp.]